MVLVIVTVTSIQLVSAQKTDTTALPSSSKHLYDLYWRRHKTFNTIGWLLVAPGAAMFITGLAEGSSNSDIFSSNYSYNKGEALFFIGGAMVLASIPCFILSGTNAHRAYLELKNASVPGPGGFNYASVGVKMRF